MRTQFRKILLPLLILTLAAPSYAQNFDFVSISPYSPSNLATTANYDAIMSPIVLDPDEEDTGLSKASLLAYTPSSSRTRYNLESFVKKTSKVDPKGAAELEQLLAQEDVIGQAGAVMRSAGLNKNNVADAFAVYWINAWSAAYADFTPTSRKMAQSVARQAAAGLSQSPEFAKATNAQKQEMAEALLVQAAMIEGAARAAQSDAATLRKVGQAVMQGARASGLDLDKMTLTDNGFVKATK